MMRVARTAALVALVRSSHYSASAATDGISTTSPETDTPDWLSNESLVLKLINTNTPNLEYPVLPLTVNMGLNGSANTGLTMSIQGDITLADQTNYNKLRGSGNIAYLSCDNPDQADNFNITPNKMLNQLMGANLSAIILYSSQTNWCSFDRNDGPGYSSIVTMADKGDAADVLAHISGQPSNQTLFVSIRGNSTTTPSGSGSSSGPHSSVAMSVLYSITGLITLLFLAIIIIGTIRAHRHPERYGPRNAFGRRPRQSRAKGIARAVLDTLPIVKFGNDEHTKPDPDLELEQAGAAKATSDSVSDRENPVATGGLGTDVVAKIPATTDGTANDGAAKETLTGATAKANTDTVDVPLSGNIEPDSTESAIAESASAHESTEQGEEHLGCSICTEDFTVGEDVRVLPCNHQFHPDCVDPWLVNVSGTCPLCRYDLQPNRPEESETPGTDSAAAADLPPPLSLEAEEGESHPSSSQHRASRLFDFHRLRHLPQQERIEALREMRTRNEEITPPQPLTVGNSQQGGEAEATHAESEERGRATRLATKLRDKFRIRTRAQT